MSGTRQRALELLAQNIPGSQVAAVLGVSESAISQLLGDEGFAEQLQQQKVQVSEKDAAFDKKLDEAEELSLDNISKRLQFGKLSEQLAAFRVLNQAKRRKDTRIQHGHEGQGTTVNVQISVAVLPNYVKDDKNQIVEVDGRTMLTASTGRLNELAAEKSGTPLLEDSKTDRTKAILESATRSVMQPLRRQTKRVHDQDIIDLI